MGDLFKIRIFSSTLASLIVAIFVLNIDVNAKANKAFAKPNPFIVHGLNKGTTNVVNASIAAPEVLNDGYAYKKREPENVSNNMCNAKNYQFLIGSKIDILNFFFVQPDSIIRNISNEKVSSKYHQRLVIEHNDNEIIIKASCV